MENALRTYEHVREKSDLREEYGMLRWSRVPWREWRLIWASSRRWPRKVRRASRFFNPAARPSLKPGVSDTPPRTAAKIPRYKTPASWYKRVVNRVGVRTLASEAARRYHHPPWSRVEGKSGVSLPHIPLSSRWHLHGS